MNFVYKFYLRTKVCISKIKLKNNRFACDLFAFCKTINLSVNTIFSILLNYREHMAEINEFLYLKLSSEDREIFIRFFLKRFFGIDTATEEEIKIIDEAFSAVENMYVEKCEADGSIEFNFKNKKIKFYSWEKTRRGENEAETRLLNYYDVAHAFYLTEYEKNGFNPENGMTILDCGAAHGDTTVMFHTLYPDSLIYSFEFGDIQFSNLKKNLSINNIEKVVPVLAFLYSDSGKHFLNSDYKIVDTEFSDGEKNCEMETIAIDDYVEMKGIEKIGLIKFDIEGGEQAALQGAIKTIKKDKPLLYVPIYHLHNDIYEIPKFLHELDMPMEFSLKWTEKKVWGVDCVLFVHFM